MKRIDADFLTSESNKLAMMTEVKRLLPNGKVIPIKPMWIGDKKSCFGGNTYTLLGDNHA